MLFANNWRGVLYSGFFFSSRRRHTRCLSDWSSDVCSSDLRERAPAPPLERSRTPPRRRRYHRSEERRVGKECRSRWSPHHQKKKVRNQKNEDSDDNRVLNS